MRVWVRVGDADRRVGQKLITYSHRISRTSWMKRDLLSFEDGHLIRRHA